MKIVDINSIKDINEEVAIALGNFDGVHIAHQKLIKTMIADARKLNIASSVLLFENHTKEITGEKPKLLSSDDEKLSILKDLGVDLVYKIEFNKEVMSLAPEDFIKEILVDRLNVRSVTVGFDYRFGYKAKGTTEDLIHLGNKYNMKVNILDPIYTDDGEIVSSTRIRKYLEAGNIEKANNMLGRRYSITGKVIKGNQIGRELGFPTANIEVSEDSLIPKFGIYAAYVSFNGKRYLSGTNIGITPSFNNNEIKLENHILDFEGDIYGYSIKTEFIEYLREEIKFDKIEDLKKQMTKDINYIGSLDK